MSDSIGFKHYNHINQTVHDFDAAVCHVTEVLGGQFLWETPPNPFTRACLVNFGGAVIELVEKIRPMKGGPAKGDYSFWHCVGTTGFIMDWDRIGPSFVGCEFLVANLSDAISAAKSNNLRVFDQRDFNFFLTYSEQCHGIAFEITDVDWYQRPSPKYYREEMRDASYWRDEHPLGIESYRFSVVVADLTDVAGFFERFCGADIQNEEYRPRIAAQALTLRMGNIVVDFLAPTGDGPIRSFLDRYGQRIRALIFGVRDMDNVRRYFDGKMVPLVCGDTTGSVALSPDQNLGVLYQFEMLP
jgi:hypothetical protein